MPIHARPCFPVFRDMDNLCHTLAGLALAEAGIVPARRRTRWMAALAANAPDVDVVAAIGGYGLASLDFRRGITHGVLAMALWPLLIAGVTWGLGRRARAAELARGEAAERFAPLLALAAVAVWSHSFLDWLNTYGVRLLAPFDWRWFHGDAVFIVDPWLWMLFAIAVIAARRGRGVGAARVTLAVAAAYVAAMIGLSRYAAARVSREAATAGRGAARHLMTAPRPALPTRRDVVRDLGGSYELGTFSLLSRPSYVAARTVARNADLPAARAAAATRDGATFLRWSRFPVFEPLDGGRVRIYDLRYSSPDGGGRSWASVEVQQPR